MIKHVFLDIDGTLIKTDGRLTAQTIKTIRQANFSTTLVSARAPFEMQAMIQALGLTGPQIGFNGGIIFQQGVSEPLAQFPISADSCQQLVEYLQTSFPTVSQSYYTATSWLTTQIDAEIKYEQQVTHQQPTVVTRTALNQQLTIFKVMLIIFDADQMATIKTQLQELQLPDISIKQSGDWYLEITSEQAQKSTGIARIRAMNQLQVNELAAFGDGENDMPMFQAVGVPIAMGNANDVVKQHARYVTRTNDEDGVAYGIARYLANC